MRQAVGDYSGHKSARTVDCFLVSACLRWVVGIPEILVGIPCPSDRPVRLKTMATGCKVLRRLPAISTSLPFGPRAKPTPWKDTQPLIQVSVAYHTHAIDRDGVQCHPLMKADPREAALQRNDLRVTVAEKELINVTGLDPGRCGAGGGRAAAPRRTRVVARGQPRRAAPTRTSRPSRLTASWAKALDVWSAEWSSAALGCEQNLRVQRIQAPITCTICH